MAPKLLRETRQTGTRVFRLRLGAEPHENDSGASAEDALFFQEQVIIFPGSDQLHFNGTLQKTWPAIIDHLRSHSNKKKWLI